jgi:hypothetical protein
MIIGYVLKLAEKYYIAIETDDGTYIEWGVNGRPYGWGWAIESADSIAERKACKGYKIVAEIEQEPIPVVVTDIVIITIDIPIRM